METSSQVFQEGEHLDVFDETSRWCNAEIIKFDPIKRIVIIHYTGMSNQYDEIIPTDSPRIQKQWRRGMPFRVNNRLDIFDIKDQKWREARIVEIQSNGKNNTIKIKFRGYSSKYDEWIDCYREALRIMEVGSFSNAEGFAKYSQRMRQELIERENEINRALKNIQPQKVIDGSGWGVQFQPKQEFDYEMIDWQREEDKFRKELAAIDLRIIEMGGDGNCLFRAIAHQMYGDEDLHWMIRQKCMDYILSEKDYYKDFIVGGDISSVEAYVARKRQNAVWGDDVEIQALSEIYNRPIEIYAYSKVALRTFHESIGQQEPIKLSYHDQSHYNSIVPKNWNHEKKFIKQKEGEIEDQAIQQSKVRKQEGINSQITLSEEEKDSQNRYRLMAQMIQRSREEFQIQSQVDMEKALRQSMAEANSKPGSTALYKQLENQNIMKAITESQNQMTEEQMIRQALEESMKNSQKDPLANMNIDEVLLSTIIALSNNDQVDKEQMSQGVKFALENGFTLEQAIEAQSVMGDDPNLILNYLFDKISSS